MERERETSSSGGRTLNRDTIIVCLNSYIFILFLFLLFFFYLLDNEEACDQKSLLFLLLLSCMVAPIGNIANKFNFLPTFSSTIVSNIQQGFLPTVFPTNSIGMDKSSGITPSNNIEVRGRTPFIQINLSRDTSMSSTCSSMIYHERMANNGMDINPDPPTDSPALSYEME